MQYELRPGVALNVGYFRTSYGNFLITDNEALTAADFDEYGITRPRAPSQGGVTMPGVGERQCGFFDVTPTSNRSPSLVRKLSSDVGERTEVWDGVDVTLNGRCADGALVAGGLSIGRTTTDACDSAAKAPETTFTIDGSAAGLPEPTSVRGSSRRLWRGAVGAPILATYAAPADEAMASLPGSVPRCVRRQAALHQVTCEPRRTGPIVTSFGFLATIDRQKSRPNSAQRA